MFESTGILHYETLVGDADPLYKWKVFLEVDSGISEYYRALLPKWIKTNRQFYAPHISVVRKEQPLKMENWGKHEGEEVAFSYSNIIHFGQTYYWLEAYSSRLIEIRQGLGLYGSNKYSKPPDGKECFHITIANVKNVPWNEVEALMYQR